MRVENKNKQKMLYSQKGSKVPVYELNDDGTIKYITIDGVDVAVTTGDFTIGYSIPTVFKANISMSGGETVPVEYGLDYSAYDAVIVTSVGEFPFGESDLIWHTSEPIYKDADETIVDENSADYRVVRVSKSINYTKYLLSKVVK